MAVDDVVVAGWMVDKFGVFASLCLVSFPAVLGTSGRRFNFFYTDVPRTFGAVRRANPPHNGADNIYTQGECSGECEGKISKL